MTKQQLKTEIADLYKNNTDYTFIQREENNLIDAYTAQFKTAKCNHEEQQRMSEVWA